MTEANSLAYSDNYNIFYAGPKIFYIYNCLLVLFACVYILYSHNSFLARIS